MTNPQALIMLATAQEILNNLLTSLVGAAAAAELMAGTVTTAAPTGIVGDWDTIKDTYDGAPTTFVSTQANVDDLDDVIDAIVALSVGDPAAQSGDAYDALQTASPEV